MLRNALRRSVFGSRLRSRQAASSASWRARTPSGVMSPAVWFIQCAYRAATRKMRGLDPPIQIGSGCCVGFGAHGASVTRYRLPA